MDSTLRIAVFNEKGIVPVTIVHLTGVLDWKTHQDFEDRTFEAIAAGADNILIDMGGVDFMGSAGIRALHAIAHRIRTARPGGAPGRMALLNPSEAAMRVLKTVGLDSYFGVHDNLAEALKSF